MTNNRVHGPHSKAIPDIDEYIKKVRARWRREVRELAKKLLRNEQKD